MRRLRDIAREEGVDMEATEGGRHTPRSRSATARPWSRDTTRSTNTPHAASSDIWRASREGHRTCRPLRRMVGR